MDWVYPFLSIGAAMALTNLIAMIIDERGFEWLTRSGSTLFAALAAIYAPGLAQRGSFVVGLIALGLADAMPNRTEDWTKVVRGLGFVCLGFGIFGITNALPRDYAGSIGIAFITTTVFGFGWIRSYGRRFLTLGYLLAISVTVAAAGATLDPVIASSGLLLYVWTLTDHWERDISEITTPFRIATSLSHHAGVLGLVAGLAIRG